MEPVIGDAARDSRVPANATTPPLSVVMPVNDEAPVLRAVIDGLIHDVLDRVPGGELVVVDDHSVDDSPAIIASAAGDDVRITGLRNETQLGHGPSVRRGIDESTGTWVLLIDSDGQLDPADFGRLWARADAHDLVLGTRTRRSDPTHRLLLMKVTQLVASACSGHRIVDANTPFRLVRRSLLEHLAIPDKAFAPSVLMTVGAVRSGARVARVPVTHGARPSGHSSLRIGALGRAIVRSTAQTLSYSLRRIDRYGR